MPSTWQAVILAWILFLLYWAISALSTNRSTKKESATERIPLMLSVVIGATLLFRRDLQLGVLNQGFTPDAAVVGYAGLSLTWLGIAIAIWARYHIGQYWSGRVTLKEDHKLIRTGPYRWIRHPIYTGIAIAMIGTSLVVGEWRALVGSLLVTFAHVFKARKEEAWLTTQFGRAYQEYRHETGFLLPRLRGIAR